MTTCIVVSAAGADSRSLPAVLMAAATGVTVPERMILYNASGKELSPILKGICRHFMIETFSGENESDVHSRYSALSLADGPCWLLDDDCFPDKECLLRLSAGLYDGSPAMQGSKIDIVRQAQFGTHDWNWANEYRTISRPVLTIDSCCMIVNSHSYRTATEIVLSAGGKYNSNTCGDMAVGAVYAARYGAFAVGDAFVYHIPNTPARWVNYTENDKDVIDLLRDVLSPAEHENFLRYINRLKRDEFS